MTSPERYELRFALLAPAVAGAGIFAVAVWVSLPLGWCLALAVLAAIWLAGVVARRLERGLDDEPAAERDVPQAVLAEVERAAACETAAAQRLAQSGRDLVTNFSHEIKTPLTAIRGAAETLRDGALGDERAGPRFVRRILEQCERMARLLGDLLTLARLESDAAPGRDVEVDLQALARQAVEVVAPLAEQRQVRISFEVEEATPPFRGDPTALDCLLLNLLDNAVKYNRPGGEVRLRLERLGEGVLIEVADDGLGVPQGDRERIFERFYRVDKGRARNQGGTGLGLTIVQEVVRAHRGTVEVESSIGRGSTFRVRLPGQPAGA